MKEIFNKENELYSKDCFNEALNIGIDFKLNAKFKEKNYDASNFSDLLKSPVEGIELQALLEYFKKDILPYCSNFANPNFMGFPDSGNSVGAICGTILSDFLQQNLISPSFCAPIATYMEIAVIKWFRELLGYKTKKIDNIWDVGGIITYGGTGSNSTAMLIARENHKKNTMTQGIQNPENFKIIIPKGIGHYSIRSSQMWIGCGDNTIEVKTKDYRYDLKELEKVLVENKNKIMAVICYAGDSRTMTIDNFKKIYDLVKRIDSNIWLHADACHGFSLAFSEKLKSKIAGIELFDSIAIDPHKVMLTPYCISALLVKDPKSLKLITSTSDLIMQEDFAFGQITPFIGSKSWVSLKVWFMMKNLGIKKIGEIIEKRCEMAQYLYKKINESDDFVVLNSVNINSVVFMYVKNKNNINNYSVKDLNELNLTIHEKMLKQGRYHLHKFSIYDDNGIIKKDEIVYPLRFMSGNPNITKKDIDEMVSYIRTLV